MLLCVGDGSGGHALLLTPSTCFISCSSRCFLPSLSKRSRKEPPFTTAVCAGNFVDVDVERVAPGRNSGTVGLNVLLRWLEPLPLFARTSVSGVASCVCCLEPSPRTRDSSSTGVGCDDVNATEAGDGAAFGDHAAGVWPTLRAFSSPFGRGDMHILQA